MTTELKPCPFCGGEAKHRATDGYHYVICSNGDCKVMPATARYDSAEEADFAWNERYLWHGERFRLLPGCGARVIEQ